MRGTCSPSLQVTAEASLDQIIPDAFRTIAIQTFVPYSCITWAAGWLGIAEEAVSSPNLHAPRCEQTARP